MHCLCSRQLVISASWPLCVCCGSGVSVGYAPLCTKKGLCWCSSFFALLLGKGLPATAWWHSRTQRPLEFLALALVLVYFQAC